MNREDLENLVIEATGRSDKLTLIRSALDIAVGEISSQRLWSDLQVEDASVTTTVDSPSVSLASDVARVVEIRLIDGLQSRKLLIRPKTWLISHCPSPESRSSARPVYGYLEGTELFLIPVPDDTYELRYTYFRQHPALAAPTDEILIRGAGPCVAAYATYWVFQSLEKIQESDHWYATYLRLLESAKKLDKDNTVVQYEAEPRGYQANIGLNDYWLDPYVQKMP